MAPSNSQQEDTKGCGTTTCKAPSSSQQEDIKGCGTTACTAPSNIQEDRGLLIWWSCMTDTAMATSELEGFPENFTPDKAKGKLNGKFFKLKLKIACFSVPVSIYEDSLQNVSQANPTLHCGVQPQQFLPSKQLKHHVPGGDSICRPSECKASALPLY